MLRLATKDDAAFIGRVVISCWRDTYRDFLRTSLLTSLDRNLYHDARSWERRIAGPGSLTWIISDQGVEIGVLRITIGKSSVPGTGGQLTTLYLLSHARRHGLGSKALVFARAEAWHRAPGPFGVCMLAGNKAGRRFYERRGARRIGERVAFYSDHQPIMDVLYRFADPSASACGTAGGGSAATQRTTPGDP